MRELELYIPTMMFSSHGALNQLGRTCLAGKSRILLLTNSALQNSPSLGLIRQNAEAAGIDLIIEPEVSPYSTDEVVDAMLNISRISYIEGVIGFGDATALSIARAVAVLHNSVYAAGDLEQKVHIQTAMLPYLEIPTALSSPFFFNGGMVLSDRYEKTPRYIDIPGFVPCSFLQDPAVLKDISRKQRIAALLETLLMAVEGYFSKNSTYFSDTLLLRGIGLSLDTLPDLLKNPEDQEVLFRAMQAGFFTAYGLSMSSPGWGTSASQFLAQLQHVPTAIVATILLPYVLEYGLKVCPEKVARMGNMLGENLKGLSVVAAADRVVESIRTSLGVEQLPGRLSELGIQEKQLSQTVAKVMEVPFIQALPAPLGSQELFSFLKTAL